MERTFSVPYTQRVLFTRDVFGSANTVLRDLLAGARMDGRVTKALGFVDSHVAEANPGMLQSLQSYAARHPDVFTFAAAPALITGGEACKNDFALVEQCWGAINDAGLDRHSFVFVIGGGAVLDLVCFAASTAHRGIRHVRFPTTTLSQGDGGVGVKNGVNYFGKKNWIGTFAVPYAIVNDFAFLDTLPPREKRCGLIEAIKVALIRDAEFLPLAGGARGVTWPRSIHRSWNRPCSAARSCTSSTSPPTATLSSRARRVRSTSDTGRRTSWSRSRTSRWRMARPSPSAWRWTCSTRSRPASSTPRPRERVLALIERVGFRIFEPELLARDARGELTILAGLEEFREHLGGELTVTLVPEIGRKIEVHEMDSQLIVAALEDLSIR